MNTMQTNVVETFERNDWTLRTDMLDGVLLIEATHEAWPTITIAGTIGKRGSLRLKETHTYSNGRPPESVEITKFARLAESARTWSRR
jgi:hypothetical protein